MDFVFVIVFFFFIITLIILLIELMYLFLHNIVKKKKNKKFNRTVEIVKKYVDNKSEDNRCDLLKHLKKASNLILFEKIYDENILNINIASFETIIKELITYYKKKNIFQKIYFSHFLYKINFYNKDVIMFLESLIKYNHILCVDNVLRAIIRYGNKKLLIDNIKYISNIELEYSAKLLSDNLLEYSGNKEELINSLLSIYNKFNDNIRCAVIIFARYIKYSDADSILKLFKKEKNKECLLAFIRYFGVIKKSNVDKNLIDFSNKNIDFEYTVVTIQTLSNYKNKFVKNYLLEKINSDNFYIMSNALRALSKYIDLSELKYKYSEEVDNYIDFIINGGC